MGWVADIVLYSLSGGNFGIRVRLDESYTDKLGVYSGDVEELYHICRFGHVSRYRVLGRFQAGHRRWIRV